LFRRSLRERGFRPTFRKAAAAIFENLFDLAIEFRDRTGTSGIVPLTAMEIKGENRERGEWYAPSGYRIIGQTLSALDSNTRRQTFVDFGCGKGRVLLRAARQDFSKVIGVEFAGELCEQARAVCRRKGVAAEIVHADATEFPIPADAGVFYFFNPFGSEILDKVLARISDSVSAHPREIRAIYVNAVHAMVFERRGYRVLRRFDTGGFSSYLYGLDAIK
jgi:SAM-dependent methyltransferase